MLTARVEDLDKIQGLMLGVDDYITKPFNPLELLARVKTQLRRYTQYNQSAQPEKGGEYEFNGLYISEVTHKCTLYGEEMALTPLEFSILWYLCSHRGQVVPSEQLFQEVWGEKYRRQQHRDDPYRPPAGKDARKEPPSEIYQNCLGSGIYH